MKRRNIFGIAMGIIVVICILMAMVQFKKEQIAQSEVDAAQKEDVTVLPDGVAIKKVDDDEDYDTSKNACDSSISNPGLLDEFILSTVCDAT